MNRLNKIFSFVLFFSICLLFNVSNAIEVNVAYTPEFKTYSSAKGTVSSSYEIVTGYTVNEVKVILDNYQKESSNEVYKNEYETLLSSIVEAGKDYVVYHLDSSSLGYEDYLIYIFSQDDNFSFCSYQSSNGKIFLGGLYNTADRFSLNLYGTQPTERFGLSYYSSTPSLQFLDSLPVIEILDSSVDIYNIVLDSSRTTAYWDGTYYYEVAEEPGEDTPSLPSNSEIAQAVQAFYNSDYYKNNKDFSDFIVMYNYNTKYFDFIGHNFGNKLGQQIIDANVSIGNPAVLYNERWWRYFLPDEFLNTLFNKYYWLYSTNDFGENIKYEGKGSINDLLDLHFATSSIIVYSTTDYPVNTVFKNENDETESSAEVMPGDYYTYDENLDPTTNEYNPLENFVPTNPGQTILGDVDFDEINKVFEENKYILNIENASWLFTANNQLVGYFVGFLLFLIVLLIISRILGG